MPERAPLRIAFTNIPRRLWAGGYNYQRNLFEALNRYAPGAVTPVLFAGMADDADETVLTIYNRQPPNLTARHLPHAAFHRVLRIAGDECIDVLRVQRRENTLDDVAHFRSRRRHKAGTPAL